MSRFKLYNPDQAYLLSPSARDELGPDHLCFFVRRMIEQLNVSGFEQSYSPEGAELYAPQLMPERRCMSPAVGPATEGTARETIRQRLR
jgi:transposase